MPLIILASLLAVLDALRAMSLVMCCGLFSLQWPPSRGCVYFQHTFKKLTTKVKKGHSTKFVAYTASNIPRGDTKVMWDLVHKINPET